jgi:flavin-dependent dehydrogenase
VASGRHAIAADVVVVGAGPGGAAAAIACAAAGLRVALLERLELPRERPGETLHPGVEAPLRELGVLERFSRAGFARHAGIEVAWDGPPRLVPYGADDAGPWLGFQASRARCDALLVQRARELGVVVHERRRALAPTLGEGRVDGVRTSGGWMSARYVVDAAGGGHWLARCLALALERRSPRLVARYGYATGSCPARDAAPAIVADREGWTWTARVGDGVYHWTRLDLCGENSGAREADLAAGGPHLRNDTDAREADLAAGGPDLRDDTDARDADLAAGGPDLRDDTDARDADLAAGGPDLRDDTDAREANLAAGGPDLRHETTETVPRRARLGHAHELPRELAGLRPRGGVRSADVSWRAVRSPAGPGYVAVGDAALVLDPASSHGVLRALLTGMHAARLVVAALADPRAEPLLGGEYSRLLAGWFEHDVAALRELYARLPSPPRWLADPVRPAA